MTFNLKSLDEAVKLIPLVNDAVDKRELFYVGNLKKFGQCKPLQQYHYLVSDTDHLGNLTHNDVFVQYLACQVSNLPILDGKLPVYVKDLINDQA